MKYLVGVDEISSMLNISESHAYKLIKTMNNELSNSGYCIVAGKVPLSYLEKKFYGITEYFNCSKKGEENNVSE